jgi:hypothetical protein
MSRFILREILPAALFWSICVADARMLVDQLTASGVREAFCVPGKVIAPEINEPKPGQQQVRMCELPTAAEPVTEKPKP